MGNKIHLIENRMGDMTATVNDLVDAQDHTHYEQQWMKAKMVHLEDRSRRNNVKIRGIPKSILPHDLNAYARKLISTVLPDLSPMEAIIDRIHHILKPQHLVADIPRDVLMRVHFFHAKDQLLFKTRHLSKCPTLPTTVCRPVSVDTPTAKTTKHHNQATKQSQNPIPVGIPYQNYCHQKWSPTYHHHGPRRY